MTDNPSADPAAIEQDIRQTQDAIGDTVAKLEEQLNPREIARSVVGDDGNEIATEALEITRRNPVPVALIAVGLIWLIATGKTRDGTRLVDRIAGALKPRSRRSGASKAFGAPLDIAAAPIPSNQQAATL